MKMKNVALYLRVSTGEQSKHSQEAQNDELETYCLEKGLQVYKVYADTMSGLKFEEREGLQRLLDDAENGLFDAVLVTESDRLARDPNIIGFVKLSLEQKGIKLIMVNEPETTSEYDELMSGVVNLFSSFEAKRRKRRCIRGIQKAREKGLLLNRVPLGYEVVDGKVRVDKNMASIINLIFRRRQDGKSMYRIAQETEMSKNTIAYILRNPFYWDGEIHCKHEPIINKAQFDFINE